MSEVAFAVLSCQTNCFGTAQLYKKAVLAMVSCQKVPSHCLVVKQTVLALLSCRKIALALPGCQQNQSNILLGIVFYCFALLYTALRCFALLRFALRCFVVLFPAVLFSAL